jgi:TonB-linked SusC/RagA family outer membrane protein
LLDLSLEEAHHGLEPTEPTVPTVPDAPANPLQQQQPEKVVTGIVVDETGEPLAGASVFVKGTSVGTVTDADGKFSLKITNPNATIEVSFLGYTAQQIKASDAAALKKVTLVEDALALGEVVITGMSKVDKRMFTGSSAHLNAGDIKIDGLAEISRSLEGRVAGVSVQNVSGTFGTAPKILVRGATSIYGDSQPLWVVDGVIVENVVEVSADQISSGDAETVLSSAVAGLNADDIETWDILKDAAATAIYGAKAKAGVIVITTKKGKSGQSQISYTGEFSTRLIPSYSNFNIMNSQDQMSVYQELEQKGWLNFSSTFNDMNTGIYGKMYEMMSTYDPKTGTFLLQNTEAAKNAYLREAEYRNTDWFKQLFKNSITQNHMVNISGGSDKTTYRASMSFMNDPGWYQQSMSKRYTFGAKVNHKINKTVEFEMSPRVSYRQQHGPGTMGRTVNSVYGEVGRNFDINPYQYALNSSRALDPAAVYTRNYAPFNISDELGNNYMDYNLVDLQVQGLLTWKPFKGFSADLLASTNYQMAATEHHITEKANQAMAYRAMQNGTVQSNNSYLYNDPNEPWALPETVLPYGGIYERVDNKSLAYYYRGSITYNTTIENDHYLSLFGAMEITSADKDRTWFRGWGRQYEMGDVASYYYKIFKKDQEAGSDYFTASSSRDRSISYSSYANYSYKGKYNFNLTGRYDGSNRLGMSRKARWLPTWDIGGAWNIHEEDFFNDVRPILSHAKVFTSYGLSADRGPATNSQIIIRATTPWRPETSAQETALYISSLENSELTYEKKYEFNIGTELGFFNNRINLDLQYFKRNNFDLIGRIDVMGIGGETQKLANVASMTSQGYEATITTKNIDVNGFKWTTSLIFSDIRLKVTEIKNDQRVIDLVSPTGRNFGLVGDPRRVVYSIPFAGLNSNGFPTFYNEKGETVLRINLQNRDDIAYLKYEGPAEPTTFGSLGNIFNYKNFRLNVYMTYSFGNKVRLDNTFSYAYSDMYAMPKEFKNRWILPGDENYTNIPTITSRRQNNANSDLRYAYNAYNYSDVRVADGSYVRMKEISLMYTFPKTWISKLSMKDLSMKLQGSNIFLLYADSKLNGQDPEFINSGGVAAPMAKQFTFTLSCGF